MTAVSEDVAADLKRRLADLEERLATALTERDAAIERQTASALVNFRLQSEFRAAAERQHASAEILRAISESSGDAERSLTQIAETTARLFGAPSVTIRIAEGDEWIKTIRVGASSEASGAQPGSQSAAPGANLPATVYQENRQIHIPDMDNLDPSMANWPLAATRAAGARTVSGTPLRRKDKAIGALIVYRDRLAPFTTEELALQQSFADQAVIAIENARLFDETQEALEQQTATADILKVIASSPSDVQPVFEAVVRTAQRLLRRELAFILRCDATHFWAVANAGLEGPVPVRNPAPVAIDPAINFPSRAIISKQNLVVPDWSSTDLPEQERHIRDIYGLNSALYLPLLRGGECIGVLGVGDLKPGAFSEAEIALAESFRDQAVIAIENTRLFNETKEALERQTATADILKVIASSPSDVQPVFEAIADSSNRLVGGFSTAVHRIIDDIVHLAAFTPISPEADEALQAVFPVRRNEMAAVALVQNGETAQIADAETADAYTQRLARARGWRSVTFTPLMTQGALIGFIAVTRRETGVLADHHVQLLQTFADQAVIAIENARLFNETKEALERQTATADILKVIASSPSDVRPVFEAIAERARSLLGGFSSTVYRFIEGQVSLEAFTPTTPEADEVLTSTFPMPIARFAPFEIVQAGEVAQIPDTESLTGEILDIARARGFRSLLFAPLMNQGTAIGLIAVTRASAGTFAGHHVQLLKTFADQAVIAIENARLFNETQEALERQTATADVLKVIASSPSDVQPVFEAIVGSAAKLFEPSAATITTLRDRELHWNATAALQPNFDVERARSIYPIPFDPEVAPSARAILERRIIEIPDATAPDTPDYTRRIAVAGGIGSLTIVPLIHEDKGVGTIILTSPQVGFRFSERQLALLQTFADQAVIAIENARLFDEVQARTADLQESLQQQTATADVLKVISRSTFDLQTVLETLIESAVDLSGANRGSIFLREGDVFPLKAASRTTPEFLQYWAANPAKAGRGSATSRVIASGKIEVIPDVLEDPEMQMSAGSLVRIRATLGVPMLRDNKVEGVLVLTRPEPGPFSKSQIDLVQTFADQAVIAVENVRLFDEAQTRTRELAKSLDDLRTAQDRLIQTEKLASLGQLTAGIAHEIKNPLNFVNNFAALSAELTDELKDVLKPAVLDETIRAEVDELTGLMKDNLAKVVQHGKRADSIVKNMLLHSREGSGDHRPADVNALVEESLNLAYHGARAEKPQFNVTLKRDFDPDAGMIEAFPQEITRVLLNLISNGFYAVAKRKAEDSDAAFEPVVSATTKGQGDHVEIRIRDNGTGIPPEVKEKMFNPFFTTKPAGEGTGLGLSMSHDIIVKQHGGTIDVDTQPGAFTEFTILLPRTSQFSDKTRGQT